MRIGPYRLEAALGEGATGLVFKAWSEDGTQLALKILRPERNQDRVARARFVREASLAREIESRHVVPVVGVGEARGVTYFAMRYFANGSLARRLRATGPMSLDETVALAAQLGRGLDALHDRGIVHRDVKPSNVLLDADGTAALSDFGLALARDSTRLTEEGRVVGTPHYLAPELIEGREPTRASDVYSLGCLLYECITGRPPFAGRRAAEVGFAHLAEQPVDPCVLIPRLPNGVGEALLAALQKSPEDRPTTGTALSRMLHVARTAALA
jgi:eukaryotic-like serine/threonine-protein kinase